MKTPTPRNNPRASARAARLEASKAQKVAKALQEDEARVATEEALIEPSPEIVLPPILAPGIPMTFTEMQPVELPRNKLVELASRINARFGVITRHEKVTFDHRLAWAIDIAAARKECKEKGEPWERWAKGHLELSLEMVRQYARIGSATDPEAELRRTRERNAEANREHRKQKALAAPVIALPETPPAWAGPVSRDPPEAVAHDAASEDVAHGTASEEAPVVLESDRLGNVLAGLRRLLVPDQVRALKMLAKDIPRESVIDALRTVGFVIVGFNLETAAE